MVDALCPALRAPEGAAFFALTRRHSCLSHCRTPAGPQARAQDVRRLRAVQGGRCWCGSLTRSLRGNAKGFALSFPKPQIDTPGWRASPAGPRQGIDLRFSLPLPSSPEGRRHGLSHAHPKELWSVDRMAGTFLEGGSFRTAIQSPSALSCNLGQP